MSDPGENGGAWTLLTGHGHVLVEIARDPEARIRDISAVVGLTERTVQAIVADLEAAGYLTRTRAGRRTRYTVNHDSLFRHSAQEGLRIGPFLALLSAAGGETQKSLCGTGRGARPPRGCAAAANGGEQPARAPRPPPPRPRLAPPRHVGHQGVDVAG